MQFTEKTNRSKSRCTRDGSLILAVKLESTCWCLMMSISRDPRERQKDELQALTSIFAEDVQDMRKSGKEWMPLELLITVKPQTSFNPDKESVTCLQLFVKCPHDYPYARPLIQIRDARCIPTSAAELLTEDLNRIIDENAGSEVIFNLITHTQEFLSPFNDEAFVPQPRPSIPRAVRASTISNLSDCSDQLPVVPDAQRSSYSRFAEEFEVIERLGSGGFGDVFRAKNKLDDAEYAIKKVPINLPEKQHHKIFREVKLLSRLVHDNIVRYYSNWIETESPSSEAGSSSSGEIITSTVHDPDDSLFRKSLVLPSCSLSSNYIQFGDGDDQSSESSVSAKSPVNEEIASATTASSSDIPLKRFMYIQMELCDGRTLREWIDDKTLQNDHKLRIPLFREIVEGLHYLHDRMIVHRDLKPGNIFFVDGHAKIGDLGLAISSGKGELLSSEKVGTFHYFAPELDHAESVDNIRDATKLDIFSLGITVFEMFYHVIKTGMERHQILTNLRKNPAKFPEDFRSFPDSEDYENLIREMISWDPEQRPTAAELLASSLVPRNDLQDKDKNWIIKQLTSNKADKDFRVVLDNLFANSMAASSIQHYGYDRSSDESRFRRQESTARRIAHPRDRRRISEHIKSVMIDLMKSYGAVQMTAPTFSPKSCDEDAEKLLLIDQSGNLIYPTFSLRESFVRYISNHHVSSIRRYAIEKVYRKASHPSQSPVEKTGVAFDAVFPMECPQILPEAVLTALVADVASLVPRRSSQQLVLKMSHTGIFSGILRYCDISKEHKMKEVLTLLSENSEDFAFFEKVARVKDLVNDGLKAKLIHSAFLLQRDSFSDFRDFIKQLVRRKQSAEQKLFSTEVLNALLELKLIVKAVESSTNDVTLKFCGCLIENTDSFNGFVIQLEQVKAANDPAKLIAIGGKYEISDANHPSSVNSAVGVSFDFDLIVSLAMEEDERTGNFFPQCDVVIAFHPLNHDLEKSNNMLSECMSLGRFLRSFGFKVMELFEPVVNSNDNLITFCRENRVRTSVLLVEDDKQEISCRIFEFEKDRPSEKKVQCYSQRTVADALKLMIRGETLANGDGTSSVKGDSQRPVASQEAVAVNERSNSNFINMQFLNTDSAKLALHHKKRHEITFHNLLSNCITSASNLPVLAIDLPYKQIKMIAYEIDLDDDAFKMRKNLDNACSVLTEKLPRLKKHLPLILDEIYCMKTGKKSSSTITIYSYTENKFVTIC